MSLWSDALSAATTVVRDTYPDAVVYTPAAGGGPFTLTGVFDEAHEAVEQFDGAEVSTRKPMLWIRLADLSVTPVQDDTVALTGPGRTFRVADVQRDGAGGASLVLLEA